MKRTMYQAARHTPKRQATGSNPAGGAMKKDLAHAKSFFREIHLRCVKYLLRKCWRANVIYFRLCRIAYA